MCKPSTPLQRYMARHKTPFNRALHLSGVPGTLVGFGLLVTGRPFPGLALIAIGFLLQYIGHAIEGSPMGELQLLGRLRHGAKPGPVGS